MVRSLHLSMPPNVGHQPQRDHLVAIALSAAYTVGPLRGGVQSTEL